MTKPQINPALWGRLSPAEHTIIRELIAGGQDKDIANRLGLTAHTISNTIQHIYKVLGVRGRASLMCRLYGITELEIPLEDETWLRIYREAQRHVLEDRYSYKYRKSRDIEEAIHGAEA